MSEIFRVIGDVAVSSSLPIVVDLSFLRHTNHEIANGNDAGLWDIVVFASKPFVEQSQRKTDKTIIDPTDVCSDEYLKTVRVANMEEAAQAPAEVRRKHILRQPTTQAKSASANGRHEDTIWTFPRDQNPYPLGDGTFFLFDERYRDAAAQGRGEEVIVELIGAVPQLKSMPLPTLPRRRLEDAASHDKAVRKFKKRYDRPSELTEEKFPKPGTPWRPKVEAKLIATEQTPAPTPSPNLRSVVEAKIQKLAAAVASAIPINLRSASGSKNDRETFPEVVS